MRHQKHRGERIRVGVIGCGGIANAYLAVIAQVPEIELKAVADVDAERRNQVAERMKVPAYATVAAMLHAEQLDAGVVLTPPSTHEDITCTLVAAGCHVLCEKPLATNPASAMRMLAAAHAAGRTLMMASKFRYVEDVATARTMLEAGVIGQVLLFENVFCSRVDMTKRWNSQRELAGGGVLIDNGCHSVDVARFLLGPIAKVQAQFGRQVQPIEVEDTARILFESGGGTLGSVDLSWSLHKDVTSYVRLYGSDGSLEIGWKSSRYKNAGEKEWKTFGNGYDKHIAFQRQLANFARSVLGIERPEITAEDGVWSVRVIDAAYRSARSDEWVDVAPVDVAVVEIARDHEQRDLGRIRLSCG